MLQRLTQSLTFDQFVASYGDDPDYELIDGELVAMEPTGPYEQVAELINLRLNVEIHREQQPFFIPMRCLIKPLSPISALRPDVFSIGKPFMLNPSGAVSRSLRWDPRSS